MADPRIPAPPPGYEAKAKQPNIPPPPVGFEQQLSAPDPISPMSQAMGNTLGQLNIRDEPTMYPPLAGQATASLPTMPDAKFRTLAKAIFPDIPENQALERMGASGGRIFYIGYDGNAYYAEPSFDPMSDPMRTLKSVPDFMASNVGPGMETAGGIAGGLFTSAGGGVPGAMAGGAAANTLRQGLSRALTGEEKPWDVRLREVGGAALQEGSGQLLGLGLSKAVGTVLDRNPLKIAGHEVVKLPEARIRQIEADTAKARQFGVNVTPGEAGDITSLIQRQRQLGRFPTSTDALTEYYRKRNEQQLPSGWAQVLDQISDVSAPGLGARQLTEGAEQVIKSVKEQQRAVAGPLYKAAVNEQNQIPAYDFEFLMADDAIKSAFKAVRNDKVLNSPIKSAPDNSLIVLDETKKHLDGLYNTAQREGQNNRARILDDARKKLIAVADANFADYAPARQAYSGMVPEVQNVTEGLTGLVAEGRVAGQQNIPRILFDAASADPISLTSARNAFEKAGRMDEWNAGLRSYLQNVFDAAAKQDQGPAPSLFKTLKADTRQFNNLKAAMTPDQFRTFSDFMDVVEMVKRAPKEGSPTATDLGADKALVGPGTRAGAAVLKGINVFKLPENVADFFTEASIQRNAAKLVDLITSPNAAASLRRLKVLKPGTQKFIEELGYLSTIGATESLSGGVEDRSPSILESPR